MPLSRWVGVVMKGRRRALRLSQAKLSKATGVSRAEVCLVERGAHNPRLDTLERLCAGLDCEVAEVIVEAGSRSRKES